jgi:hypothetical protein
VEANGNQNPNQHPCPVCRPEGGFFERGHTIAHHRELDRHASELRRARQDQPEPIAVAVLESAFRALQTCREDERKRCAGVLRSMGQELAAAYLEAL